MFFSLGPLPVTVGPNCPRLRPGAEHFQSALDREDFDVPVALITVGWDPAGDPTHLPLRVPRDLSCATRLLDLPRVVTWFDSHTQMGSIEHPKVYVYVLGVCIIVYVLFFSTSAGRENFCSGLKKSKIP